MIIGASRLIWTYMHFFLDRIWNARKPLGLFPEDNLTKQEYATKLALISFFWATFVTLTTQEPFRRPRVNDLKVRPFDLVMLSLSTYRLGRLIAFDKITEPLRYPFTKTVKDDSGAGETVEPRGKGIRKAFGELISCPICAGTWVSAALVYAFHIIPRPTRIFMAIMSSIGLAELLNALTEALSWMGEAARQASGNHHE